MRISWSLYVHEGAGSRRYPVPDYKEMDQDQAIEDFKKRIRHYEIDYTRHWMKELDKSPVVHQDHWSRDGDTSSTEYKVTNIDFLLFGTLLVYLAGLVNIR